MSEERKRLRMGLKGPHFVRRVNMFDEKLVPEFGEFAALNKDFTWWAFIGIKADLYTALSFSKLFGPEIVQYDGCYILKDGAQSRSIKQWRERFPEKNSLFEKNVNRHCVGDLFVANEIGTYSIGLVRSFAEQLKYFWALTFLDRYPEANLEVEIYFDEEDQNWFVTVYSKNHGLPGDRP